MVELGVNSHLLADSFGLELPQRRWWDHPRSTGRRLYQSCLFLWGGIVTDQAWGVPPSRCGDTGFQCLGRPRHWKALDLLTYLVGVLRVPLEKASAKASSGMVGVTAQGALQTIAQSVATPRLYLGVVHVLTSVQPGAREPHSIASCRWSSLQQGS